MISVATGGSRIEQVQAEFEKTFDAVSAELSRRGIENSLPYRDLWQWYGRWSGTDELKTYQSRRNFVSALFDPLVATVAQSETTTQTEWSNPMARRSTAQPPIPSKPKLNTRQMQAAIERIERRMKDVDGLNISELDKWSPIVDALQASIDHALARAFGQDTIEYKRYRRTVNWAQDIPSFGADTTLEQYRADVTKGKAEVLVMLQEAMRALNEELEETRDAESPLSPTSLRHSSGQSIVIGHGASPLWRELKDFVKDTLNLPVAEFNSVSVAGVATVARLTEMLNDAAFAFIVMTAEDEQPDGSIRARENVVHEAGLFQGRLGFKKAIILLEGGCKEFSNIQGGKLGFPRETSPQGSSKFVVCLNAKD
jgi:hypothetical protein